MTKKALRAVSFRVSAEEYERLERASLAHVRTIASYARLLTCGPDGHCAPTLAGELRKLRERVEAADAALQSLREGMKRGTGYLHGNRIEEADAGRELPDLG